MIQVKALSFSVGEFQLDQLNLEVPEGEYFVLLGRPGSGKTTFLECLCGLNRPQSGEIRIAKQNVTNMEPRKRKIGYVPQDYALFPHLSVEKNIGFGLRGYGVSSQERLRKVSEKASLLGIEHLLKRNTMTLSGGERQRVALARALTIEPKVLLLDEPVSALDESTRENVCIELRKLQKNLGVTTIHICHNLEEAFIVGKRGGILNNGAFEQLGAMNELLRKPASEFCARFMRCENFFSGQAKGPGPIKNSTCVESYDSEFMLPGKYSGNIKFIVRPEDIQLQNIDNMAFQDTYNQFHLKVLRIIDRGIYIRIDLLGKFPLIVSIPHYSFDELKALEGTKLLATVKMERIHVISQ